MIILFLDLMPDDWFGEEDQMPRWLSLLLKKDINEDEDSETDSSKDNKEKGGGSAGLLYPSCVHAIH